MTTTVCTKALTPQQVGEMMSLGNAAGGSCTARLLTDEPAVVVFESRCASSGPAHVLRTTLRAVDARRVDAETRSSVDGQPETIIRTSSTYVGACPANLAGATASGTPKPSPAECREIADMRRQIETAGKPCAELPAAYRAQCVAQTEAGRKMYGHLARACQ